MTKKYMERIEALRQQYLSTRVDMDVYNAKYVTEGFKETEGQPWIIQKATGYARTCEKKQIYIQDHELLVGGVGFKPRCGILNPDSASGVIEKELDTISTRPFDPFYMSEDAKKVYLEDVKDYWKNKCVFDRWRLMAPKDMETLRTNGIIFIDRKAVRGYGETTVDWRRLLAVGLGGIKKEAEEKLAVEAGYWHNFRFNPAAENKFTLDSKAPTGDYQAFLKGEVRYASLALKNPERAAVLFEKNEEAAKERYAYLSKLVALYGKE